MKLAVPDPGLYTNTFVLHTHSEVFVLFRLSTGKLFEVVSGQDDGVKVGQGLQHPGRQLANQIVLYVHLVQQHTSAQRRWQLRQPIVPDKQAGNGISRWRHI